MAAVAPPNFESHSFHFVTILEGLCNDPRHPKLPSTVEEMKMMVDEANLYARTNILPLRHIHFSDIIYGRYLQLSMTVVGDRVRMHALVMIDNQHPIGRKMTELLRQSKRMINISSSSNSVPIPSAQSGEFGLNSDGIKVFRGGIFCVAGMVLGAQHEMEVTADNSAYVGRYEMDVTKKLKNKSLTGYSFDNPQHLSFIMAQFGETSFNTDGKTLEKIAENEPNKGLSEFGNGDAEEDARERKVAKNNEMSDAKQRVDELQKRYEGVLSGKDKRIAELEQKLTAGESMTILKKLEGNLHESLMETDRMVQQGQLPQAAGNAVRKLMPIAMLQKGGEWPAEAGPKPQENPTQDQRLQAAVNMVSSDQSGFSQAVDVYSVAAGSIQMAKRQQELAQAAAQKREENHRELDMQIAEADKLLTQERRSLSGYSVGSSGMSLPGWGGSSSSSTTGGQVQPTPMDEVPSQNTNFDQEREKIICGIYAKLGLEDTRRQGYSVTTSCDDELHPHVAELLSVMQSEEDLDLIPDIMSMGDSSKRRRR